MDYFQPIVLSDNESNGPPRCVITCVPERDLRTCYLPEKEDVGVQPDAGYAINIEDMTLENRFFRRVLYTIPNGTQLAIMSLPPGQSVGQDVHPHSDQTICVVCGEGVAKVGNDLFKVGQGALLVIPRGIIHDIGNSGMCPLQLYTLYSRAIYEPGFVDEVNPRLSVGVACR